ncbi:MAG: hypothetical protein M5U34_32610 [Chloroflexi bacterium]|nr:hypothetical protein [Chloroflexota bacterium]
MKTGIKQLRMPMLVAIIALLLIGAGLVGQKLVARSAAPESVATATLEGFAADPNEENAVSTPDAAPMTPSSVGRKSSALASSAWASF